TKLDIVNNFENKAEKKAGKFDRNNIEAAREIAKEYYDQDYPQMEKQEELLKKEIFENIETHNILSLLTPTTFFQLTGKEVGSHGYQNAIAYYIYLLELKRDFVWFYFERTFFNNPKEMINFIKGDENIFRAKSLVPANYGAGLSVSVLWILVAAILAYFSFKRMLFPLPKSPEAFSTVDIRLNQGNSTGMSIDDTEVEGLIEQLINVFYGEFKEFPGKISIDDQDIVNKKKKDFMYITNPHQLPGQIKTGSFITITAGLANIPVQELKNELEEDDLKKRLKDIGNEKKSKILLKVAELKKCRLYIFNDFFLKIPGKSKHLLGNRIEALKNNGAAIVQLYSCINVYPKPDSMASFVFEKGKYIDLIGSRQ
ncbi:MAG: hypothetical protein GY757_12605, partial [bacterium]|nr:hypothetical protein [bacterium]